MAEILNQPLSGEEIKSIILAKIKRALDNEGRITNFAAYPSFRFVADISILVPGAVHDQIDRQVEGGVGEMPPGQPATGITVTAGQEEVHPNVARQQAGLGIPTLTTDQQGRSVEKAVVYDEPVSRQPSPGQSSRFMRQEQEQAPVPGELLPPGAVVGTPIPNQAQRGKHGR
jgi:hypothetical protein